MSYYQAGGINPAYQGTGEKYRTDHTTMGIPEQQLTVIREHPRWSWCSTVWAIISSCCCVSWCGFCGLLFSVLSYVDHKSGDYERSSFKRKCSWGCSMTGIIIYLLIIAAILVLVFAFPDIANKLCTEYGADLPYC